MQQAIPFRCVASQVIQVDTASIPIAEPGHRLRMRVMVMASNNTGSSAVFGYWASDIDSNTANLQNGVGFSVQPGAEFGGFPGDMQWWDVPEGGMSPVKLYSEQNVRGFLVFETVPVQLPAPLPVRVVNPRD